MTDTTVRFPLETAAFMQAAFDLLVALKRSDPDLAVAFEQGAARLTFDAGERVLIVSIVDEHGHGRPLVAVRCDPFDRAGLGLVGQPTSVVGLYNVTGLTH